MRVSEEGWHSGPSRCGWLEMTSEMTPEMTPEAKDDDNGKRGTIMVVDDQEMVRALVSDMLGELDYEVIAVKDGREAVTRYGEMMDRAKEDERHDHPVDLVILDMILQA